MLYILYIMLPTLESSLVKMCLRGNFVLTPCQSQSAAFNAHVSRIPWSLHVGTKDICVYRFYKCVVYKKLY